MLPRALDVQGDVGPLGSHLVPKRGGAGAVEPGIRMDEGGPSTSIGPKTCTPVVFVIAVIVLQDLSMVFPGKVVTGGLPPSHGLT